MLFANYSIGSRHSAHSAHERVYTPMEFDCGPVEMPSKINVSPVNTIAQTNSVHNQYITQTMDRYRKKKITTNIGTTQDDIGVMNSTHTTNADRHSSMSQYHQDDSIEVKTSE